MVPNVPPNNWMQLRGKVSLPLQREEQGKRHFATQLILFVMRHRKDVEALGMVVAFKPESGYGAALGRIVERPASDPARKK